MLDKLTRGVLHVAGNAGIHYVRPSLTERFRLIWLFRNFSMLPLRVLPSKQQQWMASLCNNGRLRHYDSFLDREIACVIGTIVTAEPQLRTGQPERRRAARLSLPLQIRYGVGSNLMEGEACDISETGIALTGVKVYPPGAEITVHYRFAGNPRESWARTRAVVRNVTGQRMGAEFVIIHPRDRALLRQLTVGKSK